MKWLPGPEDLMRGATVDALAGNYDLAVGGYMEFLTKYPDSPRAADAHFGLAEAYFNQKNYAQAVVEYDLFLKKYRTNDKAQSALYEKGVAQAGENELQEAIDTFNQVVRTYPNTIEATNARLRIRQIRALARHPLTVTRSN
jgi:tol-pal system protein YbgF